MCGEALVDLVPDLGEPGRYRARPGGGPANTAVALARLGTPVTMLARLSGDDFGRRLRAHLSENGVDLSHAVAAAEASSLAVVALDATGSAGYRFSVAGAADWQWADDELPALDDEVVAIHAGSLALALPPGADVLERYLVQQRPHRSVSIDPNVRTALVGPLPVYRERVQRWLATADVVKASADDVEVLHPGVPPVAVARRWAAAGPALVVITCGSQGAVAVVKGEVVQREAAAVQVVDTVGAGDTFAAALLDWLHRAELLGGRLDTLTVEDVAAALDHAARAAAITCSRRGAEPPYRHQLTG